MVNLLCIDHVSTILGGAEFNLLQVLDRIDREKIAPLVACTADGVLDLEFNNRKIPRRYFHTPKIISEFRLVNQNLPIGRAIRSIRSLRFAASQLAEIVKE